MSAKFSVNGMQCFQYWGLDSNECEPCCWMTLSSTRDTQEVLKTLDELDIEVDNADGPVRNASCIDPICRTCTKDLDGRTTTTTTV